MPSKPTSQPALIQQREGLLQLGEALRAQQAIAVDTESNSLYAYHEQVCLLQISTSEVDFLIDTLALPSLGELTNIFQDPNLEKVFHSAEYDLMVLKRDFNVDVSNLFDTRIAVRTLGWKKTGLAHILKREFGVDLNKRYQRANWGKRPLDPEMLHYARQDTHYLLPLRDRLLQQLQERGRFQEFKEACDLLLLVDPAPLENYFDPQGFWRLAGSRRISPRQAAVLREVYHYREAQAERLDRPPFKVLSNKTLLQLALEQPETLEGLRKINGVSNRVLQIHGENLLDSIRRGQKSKPPERPRGKAIDQEVFDRYERLRKWRHATARKRGVESDIILPKDTLWEIAHRSPRSRKALHRVMKNMPWRFQRYAQGILETLKS